MKLFCLLSILLTTADCYKILAIFTTSGRSHHIFFSSIVEELAMRKHDVTVVNYHAVKNLSTLNRIALQSTEEHGDTLNVTAYLNVLHLPEILQTYGMLQEFNEMANRNCKQLMDNKEILHLIKTATSFDVVIVEQFVSDCGLAIAHKLNAPTVGMTAHVLFPWTYARLGAPINPSFVPNHFLGSATRPSLLQKIKCTTVNTLANTYYRYVIQKSNQKIVNEIFPDVPDLEILGRNMTMIMVNQYFPLTGSRLYGANVVEIGGMHINQDTQILDKDLKEFLDRADSNGVVYISFGSIASNFPQTILDELKKLTQKSNLKFVFKAEISDWRVPKNVFLRKWLPQVPILCHPNVKAFISHSGMLSKSEAMNCGVPIISIPLFGDQFANAQSALENGLGFTIDILKLNADVLESAVKRILQDSYQLKAKELSRAWNDRPLSPMDTAVYWIEHVARNEGKVNMRPPTVELPLYQYLMLDVFIFFTLFCALVVYLIAKVCFRTKVVTEMSQKKILMSQKKIN